VVPPARPYDAARMRQPISPEPARRRSRWRLPGAALLAVVLSSCSYIGVQDGPLDSLDPRGPFAREIDDLFWLVFWIAVVIFVVVEGALLVAVFLFRDRKDRKEPKQVHGNTKLEITWTLIPALILAGIAVPTVRSVFNLTECGDGAMPVKVIGHQWWFEYRYDQYGIETANVLVIPADEEVCLDMTSDDVLHNYWIPQLNGKRYLVPGQQTLLRLQADEPGEYWGHCAEFCGLSHSLMRARVLALPRPEFDAWVAAQQQVAVPPEEGTLAAEGLELFALRGCTQCHTVDYGPDSPATNILPADVFNGPNLTHFADRNVFAGASFPEEGETYEESLKRWLANPPKLKPGSFMPNLGLTEQEIDALIAWLGTLK
jgi:cytochrome c oxidase subunit II